MKEQNKVSVIVPVYNAESILQGTMKMLGESYLKEIEILAVNDGSTDNSLQVLTDCAGEDSRIKVIDKKNGGVFDARNRGLEEASGEYVCFCDQDDVVEPQMYEKMYEAARKEQCSLVMCSTGKVLEGRQKVSDCMLTDAVYEGEEVITECFLPLVFNGSTICHSKTSQNMSGTIWKCMISRKFIEKNNLRFRRYVNYEDDRLFLLDVLGRISKVVLVSDVFYYWLVNQASESHKPKYIEDLYEKDLQLQNEMLDIMQLSEYGKQYKDLYENFNSSFRYTRIVGNELNHHGCSLKIRIEHIKALYQEDNFEEKIKAGRYYVNNMFARKIVCKLLERKHSFLAYAFYRFYTSLQRAFQAKSFWVGLEQKAKGSALSRADRFFH